MNPSPPAPPTSPLHWLGRALHYIVVLGAVLAVGMLTPAYLREAAKIQPTSVPPTMEEVDWHDPESSIYCIACHRQVAPAMAGLDVQRGHSQNVKLDETQLRAIERMGTIAGHGDTLICMSCHVLEPDSHPHMLAETLEDSRLCQSCHEGHYAQGTPHDLRLSAPHERNRMGLTAEQGGPCSACHMAHRFAREIVPSPLDPDGYCITCHREYGVAAGHPRASMEHPEAHCLECHNPHDASFGNFLRQPGDALCIRCHAEYGVAGGSHPLGPMDRPLPSAFLPPDGGAAAEPILACTTCHAVHQAVEQPLLRVAAAQNELCLSCHREQLTERSGHDGTSRHGQLPVLDAAQRAVVAGWGNPLGPRGELLCVSCHSIHHARNDDWLLAALPSDDTCTACHPQMAAVLGSPHDLRVSAPDEVNILGRTAPEAGACSACHAAHGPTRPRIVSAGDPLGQCTSCHQDGACGQALQVGAGAGGRELHHPDTRCTDCHDPHDPRRGSFLSQAPEKLCLSCHSDHGRMLGGPHDFAATADSPRWPAAARSQPGPCLTCHVAHGGERADLYRVGGPEPVGNHDDVCLHCHADAAWKADSNVAALHPQFVRPEQMHVDVALVPTDEQGRKRMGCRTCHDPHGAAEPRHLARVGVGEATEALCLKCHSEKQYIALTGHSSPRLAEKGFDTDSCRPCHAMHARPDHTWGNALSPRFLLEQTTPFPEVGEARLPCLACHHAGGVSPVRGFVTHAPVIMTNITQPGDPGHLPLYNDQGLEDPQGQIVCRTCHLSHGRTDLLRRVAERREIAPHEQEAIRAQVRSFVGPNVCTVCHAAEARPLYLHFHDESLRRGLGGRK